MENVTTIKELISLIEKRPLAFVRHHSLFELEAFINGFNFRGLAGDLTDIDEGYRKFTDSWIYSKLRVTAKQGWKEAIMGSCQSEAEAFQRFFDLWNEYLSEGN